MTNECEKHSLSQIVQYTSNIKEPRSTTIFSIRNCNKIISGQHWLHNLGLGMWFSDHAVFILRLVSDLYWVTPCLTVTSTAKLSYKEIFKPPKINCSDVFERMDIIWWNPGKTSVQVCITQMAHI